MTSLFYHPGCGIAGDMHLAAMLDLGVPEAHVRGELARLPLADEFDLLVEPAGKMGIHGSRVRVTTHTAPGHRHYREIANLIAAAGFAEGIERRAQQMFRLLAEAEGRIHDVPMERVHFHEVGAVDSIVDIVAAAICLEAVAPVSVYCSTIEVGSGFVDCAHGRLPVPAPATQELLTGLPLSYGGVSGECTTPTGAAILRASVTHTAPPGRFVPAATGYGVGHKDFERPNVLRLVRGEDGAQAATSEAHVKIEANIDDMPPEAFEPLMADLFNAGAGDVFSTPIVMKKSRAATCLTVLAAAHRADALADLLLNRSTTIGLRLVPFTKRVLPREQLEVPTRFGEVGVKRVQQPDGRQRWKSEHDDVARLAQAAGTDYRSAKALIDADIAAWFDRQDSAERG